MPTPNDKLQAFKDALDDYRCALYREAQIEEPYGRVVEDVKKAREKVEQLYADAIKLELE